MQTKRFVYYEEEGMFVGWLEEFPDYRSQGATLEELKENLADIHSDLTAGHIPCAHHVGELQVA
jgi:hypothetical protein